jgi:hypothetical protein
MLAYQDGSRPWSVVAVILMMDLGVEPIPSLLRANIDKAFVDGVIDLKGRDMHYMNLLLQC